MIIFTGISGGIGRELWPSFSGMDAMGISHKGDNPDPHGYKLDITNLTEIKKFVVERKSELGRITLVHLAAVKIDELSVFCDEGNWDKVMGVNLKGNFLLTRELLPIMMKEKFGRIIHIISCRLGDIGTLTYSASKYALVGMSEVLSREYAQYGITSNVLQLGYFETGMWKRLSDAKKIELLNEIPCKKLGETINIVNAIKFIIESPFVNGSIIAVDGGV